MFRLKSPITSLQLLLTSTILFGICSFSIGAIAETDDLEDKRPLKRIRLFFESQPLNIILPLGAEEPAEPEPEDEPPAEDIVFGWEPNANLNLINLMLMAAANAPVNAADIDALVMESALPRAAI